MGFSFKSLTGRDGSTASAAANDNVHASKEDPHFVHSDSDSDTLSLGARNEKEVREHPNTITVDALPGQQKAEAAALVWSKRAVYCTYAWIWVCFFMLAFQSAIMGQATFAAFSTFATAPAYTTAAILSSIIGGVLRLPIARIITLWGRAEGFVIFFMVYLLGMILLASASGVNGYAAGYVLYWIGYDAIYLIMDIFIADTTGLRNRAFTFAFASAPFICTAFTGPLGAQSFLSMTTWRWAIGAFCIIQPVVFLPLAIVFKFYQRKAEKMGIYTPNVSGRSAMQSFVYYFHEFDVIGALLLMAAFILFLLPFSLVTYGRAGYDSATFIAMLIIGILLFPVFAVWERYFARTHFVRWELFKQPTVLGACSTAAILYFSFYCWNNTYYAFVKVVYALPVGYAGYMSQIYNVGSCFAGIMFGVYVRYSERFKFACLLFALPLMFLGSGLTIYFRGNDHGIGYIVMCQIFIAFGGGTLVIGEQMAVMAAADREGIPLALALVSLSSSIGGAIGDAVAGSIYGNVFPNALMKLLPADRQNMVSTLYLGGYLTQEMFVPGTLERTAVNYAYGETQKWGGVASTCILILGIPAIAVWKNYYVGKQQNKGTMI
ncbi:hypothetical protein B0A48_08298 [Cryoendolithus antarcticus]|uniref:Major facilitator superfamily (MFS) profile domain-containing protein n=1 Tax=Cryoendolithus antarcticus TaxID=1507870 RepID=A0A1V8T520_9PEZI|nr:hypothetical protein B0A48_08298 [Cryoendolithus antarcticus]